MSSELFIQISLDPESQQILDRLIQEWDPELLLQKLADFMKGEGPKIVSLIRKRSFKGRRGNSALSRSIRSMPLTVEGAPAVRVGVFEGPALVYAGPRELGTKRWNPESPYPTIISKRPQPAALAIPTEQGGALNASGDQIVSGPRKQPQLRYVRVQHQGNVVGLIVRTRRTREAMALGSLNVVWILVSSVDLKPSFYLKRGMEEYLPILTMRLADFIQRGLS